VNLARMDLADLGALDKIAEAIFRLEPSLPVPVPVEEIAHALDISDIRALETEGFEGGLITDAEKSTGIILINENSREERQRFSIGHELGHFLSPWHKPLRPEGFLCSAQDMRINWAAKSNRAAEMEVEANQFSAQLLMPRARFLADMRRRKGVDLTHILDLAPLYKTSKEATARRYVELQDDPCAAVVSQHGKVLRLYRHEDFPFIEVKSGHPVPRESVAAIQDIGFREVTDGEEIDGSTWLPSERGQRCPTLFEQVIAQQDGFRLTLIALVDDE